MAAPEFSRFATKRHWSRDVFDAARTVARLCREAGVPLIVNDRADFAMLLDAGLHLGQDDLAPRDARRLTGDNVTIGYLQPQCEPALRRRRRTGGLCRARAGLRHRFETQSGPGGRRRGSTPLPAADREAAGRDRRHYAARTRWRCCAPAPIRWP